MKPDIYTQAQASVSTPRALEYAAFSKATSALSRAEKNADSADMIGRLDALHQNQMLWDVVLCAVCDARNDLPEQLRAQLAYLAKFTRHHTAQVREKQVTLLPLIEVNLAVMKGLRNTPQPEFAETA